MSGRVIADVNMGVATCIPVWGGILKGRLSTHGGRSGSRPVAPYHPSTGRSLTMSILWTILIILAIVALVLFILGRTRGRRGV